MSPVDLCKRTSGMVPGALLLHCHSMKSAIVGEKWYLVGRYETSGTSKAPAPATYCISLSKLCVIATKSQVTSDMVWRKLPGRYRVFFSSSSPVSIDGSLYAVGGKCSNAGIATLSRYSESAGWQIAGETSLSSIQLHFFIC